MLANKCTTNRIILFKLRKRFNYESSIYVRGGVHFTQPRFYYFKNILKIHKTMQNAKDAARSTLHWSSHMSFLLTQLHKDNK